MERRVVKNRQEWAWCKKKPPALLFCQVLKYKYIFKEQTTKGVPLKADVGAAGRTAPASCRCADLREVRPGGRESVVCSSGLASSTESRRVSDQEQNLRGVRRHVDNRWSGGLNHLKERSGSWPPDRLT
ncbi:hypothetical protein FQA47_024961 [Oryzias melastigma]|uniref:Uncharacterized protein n=1 Tax=Oryzias melastigma TaxID=30732 RepID=A0A834BV14_ORYME|nr:hypothetical protein FQA47_024961 [Oryzias melastigma]